jgi:hypothetical protein
MITTACRQIFFCRNTNYFLFFSCKNLDQINDTIDVQWWTWERERKGINDINRLFWVSKRAPNRYEAPQQFTIYLLSCASHLLINLFFLFSIARSTNFTHTRNFALQDMSRDFSIFEMIINSFQFVSSRIPLPFVSSRGFICHE